MRWDSPEANPTRTLDGPKLGFLSQVSGPASELGRQVRRTYALDDSRPRGTPPACPLRHRMRTASALVPAAHVTPPAFEYIDRSTTSCAGEAPRLSTIAAKRFPFAPGN